MPAINIFFIGLIAIFTVSTLEATEADSARGKRIAKKTCFSCHNSKGVGLSSYPHLAGQSQRYLIKQLQDIKSGKRSAPLMSGIVRRLSDRDISDISAYYSNLEPIISGARKIGNKTYNLSAKDFLALGERIYRFGNSESNVPSCSSCHSPTGKGNTLAGFPALGGQKAQYVEQQLLYFKNNKRTNDGNAKIMRAAVKLLTDIEIKAVANYVSGLKE